MAGNKYRGHVINPEWCKGCGICVAFCPKSVLALDDQEKVTVLRPRECVCCRLCELRCPDFAVALAVEEAAP